jgi:hypothetical protein
VRRWWLLWDWALTGRKGLGFDDLRGSQDSGSVEKSRPRMGKSRILPVVSAGLFRRISTLNQFLAAPSFRVHPFFFVAVVSCAR